MPRKRINEHHTHMLIGLREIGHALNVSDQTARKWIRDPNIALPASQLPTGLYASSTLLLSLWILQRMKPYVRAKSAAGTGKTIATSPASGRTKNSDDAKAQQSDVQ